MKLLNNTTTAIIAVITLLICVIDIFLRLNTPIEQQQALTLPKVPVFANNTTTTDSAPVLEQFLAFDVRWQNEVKKAQAQQQSQEEEQPLFEQTITLNAIVSEQNTVALLTKERKSTQQIEFIKLKVGDNLAEFAVSEINSDSITLTNANGQTYKLKLFKPTNYLTFTVNNNDQ